jgi:hypothetical protein
MKPLDEFVRMVLDLDPGAPRCFAASVLDYAGAMQPGEPLGPGFDPEERIMEIIDRDGREFEFWREHRLVFFRRLLSPIPITEPARTYVPRARRHLFQRHPTNSRQWLPISSK